MQCSGEGYETSTDGWTRYTCILCDGERTLNVYPPHDCSLDGHSFGHGPVCVYCGFDGD